MILDCAKCIHLPNVTILIILCRRLEIYLAPPELPSSIQTQDVAIPLLGNANMSPPPHQTFGEYSTLDVGYLGYLL